MSELTDLEITKRIAKITGLTIEHIDNNGCVIIYDINKSSGNDEGYIVFNPLKNGDITCDLIEKYKPWIETDRFGKIWAEIYDDDGYSKGVGIDKDLKRAVCLCLIEAFNENEGLK